MAKKYEKQSIDRFTFISEGYIHKMKSNNIKTIGQLTKHTKSDLRKIGLQNYAINKIDIELQLLGLVLKN